MCPGPHSVVDRQLQLVLDPHMSGVRTHSPSDRTHNAPRGRLLSPSRITPRKSMKKTVKLFITTTLFTSTAVTAQTTLPLKHAPKPTTQAITADDAMTRL